MYRLALLLAILGCLGDDVQRRRLPAYGCTDTDNGAVDPYSDGCDEYTDHPNYCGGKYEDSDFTADDMCCACA